MEDVPVPGFTSTGVVCLNKVRCSVCHNYVERDDLFYQRSLTVVCSKDCFENKQKKPKSTKRQINTKKAPTGVTRETRKEVLERDFHRCKYCHSRQNLHVHHIRYRSQGGANTADNLVTLCLAHHELVHSEKRRWQPALLQLLCMSRQATVLEAEAALNRTEVLR